MKNKISIISDVYKVEGKRIMCERTCNLKLNDCDYIFTVRAYAICHPKDEFNLIYGKKLAEKRASIKGINKASKYLQEKKKNCEKLIQDISNLESKLLNQHVEIMEDMYVFTTFPEKFYK